MVWLLAGLTTLLVSGLIGLTDGLFGSSLDELLRLPLPFPLPAGPLGDLLVYGGWIGLVYALALTGWGLGLRLWLEDVPDRQELYDRLISPFAVGGQRWPYTLLPLAVGAAGVAIFEARVGVLGAGIASLMTVVAVSLLGHALTSPTPPRPQAPTPPPPPPPPIRRTFDERLAALRESVSYHGQIVADEPMPARESKAVPVEGALAVEPLATLWRYASDGVVYEHQRRTLDLLRDPTRGRRALLMTPRGSGVDLTLVAAVLERIAQGGTVLVVCPDPASMASFWLQTAAQLGRLPLPWAPRCIILDERRGASTADPYVTLTQDQLASRAAVLGEGASADTSAEILLTTPGSLHATLLPHIAGWRSWLATLDLVIVLETDRYRAVTGGHAALVLRRLRRALMACGAAPAVLAVGLDIRDPLVTLERLGHWSLMDEQIVRADGTPAAARRFVLWQPNLDKSAGLTGSLSPGDALTEAVQLLDALILIGERPALVTTHAAVTSDDLEALREHRAWQNKDTWTPPIIDSFDGLWEQPYPPTAVVTFAFPSDLQRLDHETRHLGRGQELLLFAITPPLPSAQMLARLTRALDQAGPSATQKKEQPVISRLVPPPPPFLATVQESLLHRHLHRAIAELPGTIESVSDLGTHGQAELTVRRLKGERAITTGEHAELADPEAAATALLHDTEGRVMPPVTHSQQLQAVGPTKAAAAAELRVVDTEPIAIQVDGSTVQVVDRAIADLLLYPGRILAHNRRRFVVHRQAGQPLGATVALQPFAGGRVTTARMTNPVVRPREGAEWQLNEVEIGGGLRIRVGVVDTIVEEQIEGYRQFSWLEPASAVVATGYSAPLTATIQTRALLLAFPPESGLVTTVGVLHALEHAVRVVLPLVLDVRPDDVGVTSEVVSAGLDGAAVVAIYDIAPDGNGLADALRERLQPLLETALTLIESCPCEEGCLACLKLPDCRRRAANEELDKPATLRLLGALLGRQEATEARLARKHTTATDEQAEAIRQALLVRIFPKQIGITLTPEQRAPMRLYSLDELASHPEWPSRLAEVGGLYVHGDGAGVVWIQRFPVEFLTGIIAHEYAHNWQFTGGRPHPDVTSDPRPFVRTLLVEGFASWTQYKVLEAAGYLSPLRSTEAYFEDHPEYPVGLRFFRYLESKYGQQAPIRLFTHGWGELSLDALLDESGCQGELLNAYDGFDADWFDTDDPPKKDDAEDATEDDETSGTSPR